MANVILQVYNFGQDYDVYWDNFKVGSTTPATFESVVTGLITISSSDVEVTGLYLTNPGQAYSVLASGALSNIKVANNRIQDVGGPSTTDQIKGVYLPNGPDNVTISNNVFSKIVASSTKSADAINFGDSTTTDQNTGVVIQANNVSNITAGRGAYGVKLNNGAGVPGVQVKNNTFTGLNGLWTHAVGLETNTSGAVVTGNTFSNLTVTSGTDNAAVWFESNPSSNTATVTGNKFNGTGFYGVLINAADVALGRTATAENNWWGTPCGPGPGRPRHRRLGRDQRRLQPLVDRRLRWRHNELRGRRMDRARWLDHGPDERHLGLRWPRLDCPVRRPRPHPIRAGSWSTTGVTIKLNGRTFGPWLAGVHHRGKRRDDPGAGRPRRRRSAPSPASWFRLAPATSRCAALR